MNNNDFVIGYFLTSTHEKMFLILTEDCMFQWTSGRRNDITVGLPLKRLIHSYGSLMKKPSMVFYDEPLLHIQNRK